jgi:hypothetical protein
MNREAFK